MLPRSTRLPAARNQRGAVLIIALMFLVLLTIIGVSGISSTTIEERMAGNMRDRQSAFQAAESALRDAEIDIEANIGGTGNRDPMSIATTFATLCSAAFTNGACSAGPVTIPPTAYMTQIVTAAGWDWTNADNSGKTVAYGTYTGATPLPLFAATPQGVFRQPRYVIEYLPEMASTVITVPTTKYFRISARGWGANRNTSVTLQTVYQHPMAD